MNTKVIFAFVGGAALGVGATVLYFKKKSTNDVCECCEYAEEDMSENQNYEEEPTEMASTMKTEYNKVIKKYDHVIQEPQEERYVSEEPDYIDESPVKETIIDQRIYEEIDAAEYNSITDNDYGKSTLTLYADDVLADEYDEIQTVDETIGKKLFKKLKRKRGNDMYIRNNRIGMDYEIICDNRTYYEVTGVPYSGDGLDTD